MLSSVAPTNGSPLRTDIRTEIRGAVSELGRSRSGSAGDESAGRREWIDSSIANEVK
jgi:hypothetical protein